MKPSANNTPSQEDLELINNYTRNPLAESEVYCFTLTLCDNEVDRDFERFSLDALKALLPLFTGKTGIADHNMSSHNQKARIFKAWLEEDSTKKTSAGESYTALKAKAYMLITEENKEMIEQIEGGIKKEVSVGCSMGSMVCSICGKDMKKHECKHQKGKYYGKQLCHGILGEAKDAYEWSFVAVPAQKNAGVTKAFTCQQTAKTAESTFCAADGEAVYSRKYVTELQKQARQGELYRQQLISQIRKYALISMNKVNIETFTAGCEAMDTEDLKSLAQSLRAQAAEVIPVVLQLKAGTPGKADTSNSSFKI